MNETMDYGYIIFRHLELMEQDFRQFILPEVSCRIRANYAGKYDATVAFEMMERHLWESLAIAEQALYKCTFV